MNAANARGAAILLGLAATLLAIGLAIELGLTRPRLERIQALEKRQQELLLQRAERDARLQEVRLLAQALRVDSLDDLYKLGEGREPLLFVNQLARQARLRALNVLTGQAEVQKGLKASPFTLRLRGSYGQLLAFVRILEQSARPVKVVSFDITIPSEGAELEGVFEIVVYDPVQESEA